MALVALLRAVLRSSAFGRCPEVVPVDAEASVITGCEDAELAKLAQSAGGVSVYHQRYIVGAGIAIGDAVAQHSEQDPGHLVRGGDESPLAAAPRCDGPLEAGELSVPGFCGGMSGFDEGGAQMPGALSGGTVASLAGGLVVAGSQTVPGGESLDGAEHAHFGTGLG